MNDVLDYRKIGNRIRQERECLGISREKFAELVGLSAVYIGQIERGERKMSLDTLAVISKRLRTSLDYLLLGVKHDQGRPLSEIDEVYNLLSKFSEEGLTVTTGILKAVLPHIK